MKIMVEYEIADHPEYCYKNGEQEKCELLDWGTGRCAAFNQNPKWNCDVEAFRKLSKCASAKKN